MSSTSLDMTLLRNDDFEFMFRELSSLAVYCFYHVMPKDRRADLKSWN